MITHLVNFCNYFVKNIFEMKRGEIVKQKWTGVLIGKMHNNDVTYDDLAQELGVTKSYISMILNGSRTPPDARQRLQEAYASVLEKRTSQKEE